MTVLPISVFIITKNEEERLPATVASVKDWVDEVIIIDSGSTDKTTEIASDAGCKVMFNKWHGFGPQKVFGESQCRNDWVLNIDADEEVSPELQQRIKDLFENGLPPLHAYTIFLKMVFMGQQRPGKFAVKDHVIRLYNKNHAAFSTSTVHDSVILKNNKMLGEIKGAYLHHRCFKSMAHWAQKIDFYSTLQAQDWVDKNRKEPGMRIIFEPFMTFLKSYFQRGWFSYGIDGIIASMMYAYARTLRLAKVRELYRLKKQ